jgi:hypothetical protein
MLQCPCYLPWGHVVGLLDKCPDAATSDFYASRAVEEGWNRDRERVGR